MPPLVDVGGRHLELVSGRPQQVRTTWGSGRQNQSHGPDDTLDSVTNELTPP